MKYKVYKLFINFEKEEKWLNTMAAKGLNFVDYKFSRYTFEKGIPGEYSYRLELLPQVPSHPESLAYLEFMEEAGVESVSSYSRWVYFRKLTKDGPFDIYSDFDSKIKHYTRIAIFTGVIALINLIIVLANTFLAFYHNLFWESPNLYISTLNLAIVVLLTRMFISYICKIRSWKQGKQLHE